ncbi:MAG: response regulator, partial [Ferrovibrio sp.]
MAEQPLPRVVIVEDDDLVRSLLAEGLSDEGLYVVGSCDTSLEAAHLAEILRPDLVVMDIGLAGGDDGLLAASRIYRATGIRCLFTTGQDVASLQRRSRMMPPALGWLQKPFTPSQLAAAVKQALAQIAG